MPAVGWVEEVHDDGVQDRAVLTIVTGIGFGWQMNPVFCSLEEEEPFLLLLHSEEIGEEVEGSASMAAVVVIVHLTATAGILFCSSAVRSFVIEDGSCVLLLHHDVFRRCGSPRQSLTQLALILDQVCISGHLDVDFHEEITVGGAVVLQRHPLPRDLNELSVLHDLTLLRLDPDDPAIQVTDQEIEAEECLHELDVLLEHEVGLSTPWKTLELRSRDLLSDLPFRLSGLPLLLAHLIHVGRPQRIHIFIVVLSFSFSEDDLDVSGQLPGFLVRHTREGDRVTDPCSGFDHDLQEFPLIHRPLTLAGLASVAGIHDHTLPLTGPTGRLALRHHPRTDLTQDHPDSLAVTGPTPPAGRAPILPPSAITGITEDFPIHLQFLRRTVVEIRETDPELEADVIRLIALTGPTRSTAETEPSKHLLEDARGIHPSASPTVQTILTELIVQLSLLIIAEDLVGFRNFLELLFGLVTVVTILVRMPLWREVERRYKNEKNPPMNQKSGKTRSGRS